MLFDLYSQLSLVIALPGTIAEATGPMLLMQKRLVSKDFACYWIDVYY